MSLLQFGHANAPSPSFIPRVIVVGGSYTMVRWFLQTADPSPMYFNRVRLQRGCPQHIDFRKPTVLAAPQGRGSQQEPESRRYGSHTLDFRNGADWQGFATGTVDRGSPGRLACRSGRRPHLGTHARGRQGNRVRRLVRRCPRSTGGRSAGAVRRSPPQGGRSGRQHQLPRPRAFGTAAWRSARPGIARRSGEVRSIRSASSCCSPTPSRRWA